MITLALLVMFAAGFALARVLEGPTKTDREDQDLPHVERVTPSMSMHEQFVHVNYGGEGWEPAQVHCQSCGHSKYSVTIKGGNHMAHCKNCHRWIKNLSKAERRLYDQEGKS